MCVYLTLGGGETVIVIAFTVAVQKRHARIEYDEILAGGMHTRERQGPFAIYIYESNTHKRGRIINSCIPSGAFYI